MKAFIVSRGVPNNVKKNLYHSVRRHQLETGIRKHITQYVEELENAELMLDDALSLQSEVAEVWVQRAVIAQEFNQPQVALQFLEVAAQVDAGVAGVVLDEERKAQAPGGTLDDVIEEAHLDPPHLLAGIERFSSALVIQV